MVNKVQEKVDQPANLTRIPKKVLDREDFVKLFITQLQYQDPMKPIENHEMALQLAAFNQVDQLSKLNESFENLLKFVKALEFGYAGSMVGKLVKVEGNVGRVEGGSFLGASFELDKPANQVFVTIRDASGKIVRTITLQNLSKGAHTLDWDAKDNSGNQVPDGNYKISITVGEGENAKSITPIITGRVTSVVFEDGKAKLKVNDEQTINLEDLKEIAWR
jgi:flagellar basal-body rod modification protein FlgD